MGAPGGVRTLVRTSMRSFDTLLCTTILLLLPTAEALTHMRALLATNGLVDGLLLMACISMYRSTMK